MVFVSGLFHRRGQGVSHGHRKAYFGVVSAVVLDMRVLVIAMRNKMHTVVVMVWACVVVVLDWPHYMVILIVEALAKDIRVMVIACGMVHGHYSSTTLLQPCAWTRLLPWSFYMVIVMVCVPTLVKKRHRTYMDMAMVTVRTKTASMAL